MKKTSWGWNPPQYELLNNGKYRIFYGVSSHEVTRKHIDHETGEETEETVTEWIAYYDDFDLPELKTAIKDNNEMAINRILLNKRVDLYDSSDFVNQFSIGGINLWLDSSMRDKVRENLESSEKEGETETVLRFSGMSFPVTVEMGWQMYYSVLAYAKKCWNVTESHREAIAELTTAEELKNYDYTANYPEKLAF